MLLFKVKPLNEVEIAALKLELFVDKIIYYSNLIDPFIDYYQNNELKFSMILLMYQINI